MSLPVLFEDDHFIVINKPHDLLTHASQPGETGAVEIASASCGVKLGVHQRLDRATSGVIAFSKTEQGAIRLSKAFELRNVRKIYRALVCRIPESPSGEWVHRLSHRDGKTELDEAGKLCRSRYRILKTYGPFALLELELQTGMTHQLRVQCALAGCPILGDTLYGGGNDAPRLCLHAHKLRLLSEPNLPTFEAPPPDILNRPTLESILRAILENIAHKLPQTAPDEAIRIAVPQHSGIPELILEKIAHTLLIRHLEPDTDTLWSEQALKVLVNTAMKVFSCRNWAYRVHEASGKSHPCRAFANIFCDYPAPFTASEHGIQYQFDLSGNATGLYLDQRDNRAWVIQNAHGRVLNLFAYTCAFSLCAAISSQTTGSVSIDAASAALRKGRENFELNGIDLDGHRFITEDALKYLNKCAQNGTTFDTIICDPPSFGRAGKAVFSLDEALEDLMTGCIRIAAPKATLLFSINHRKIRLQRFKKAFQQALKACGRQATVEDIFVNDDALGILGVGTDLKTIRAVIA
ncbi:MAG: class I SAM-dependent methyltransferase [Proteobacteria bacterium]|nr:class I SAM-dependent methyltransferase [Pseudomonadota bacterium]